MEIEFITTRELKNKDGDITGDIRILKERGKEEAVVKFTCPECGNQEERKEDWKEPFLTGKGANKKMHVTCSNCDNEITILKLKKQIKKDKKKAKRKRKK